VGRGVFLITHRLARIRHADRIYVLPDGQVIELDSHADLLGSEASTASCSPSRASQYELSEPRLEALPLGLAARVDAEHDEPDRDQN
jgi:ATP-binding cassette subfamily B protein/ATP-binding cassette subfamily C protein